MMRWLILAELALALVALAWARFGSTPVPYELDPSVVLLSVALTIPFAAMNFAIFRFGRRVRFARRVYDLFENELFPLIRTAAPHELLVAAAVAGFAEELLFRGLLQPWIGLVPASLLFGLAHAPTLELLAFSTWAASVGLLLGILYELTANLAHPVLVHGLYDAVALLYIRYGWEGPAEKGIVPNGSPSTNAAPATGPEAGASIVEFAKAEALGNDFLLVDEREAAAFLGREAELARRMCDRRRGLGADGLVLYSVPIGETPARMRLVNSDGSFAEVSGNGLRCLAAYLVHRRLARSFPLEIETGAGRLSLEKVAEGSRSRLRFRANMGEPARVEELSFSLDGVQLEGTSLSMGNPHFVLVRETLDREELRRVGPLVASHERFPSGTNVELVEVLDRNRIRAAIWERGAGETASSGTGSSASAVAVLRKGLVDSPVRVDCAGGSSTVEWAGEPGSCVYLTGDAAVVAEGRYYFGGSES